MLSRIFSIALLTLLCVSISCNDDPTSPKNTAPTASFIVSPSSGNTSTIFQFDASGCSDTEDPISTLQVRWDWDNDDDWETSYSTTKTLAHQYSIEGTKTIKLEVKDSGGLTNSTTRQISVFAVETGTVDDIDGNTYQTIKIGTQWWMAENFKATHYRNGETIPNVTGNTEWTNLSTGAWCSYGNNDNNVFTFGRLYNWYAVNDSRNIAPAGWHVPTDTEWQTLVDYLDGESAAGGKMKGTGTIQNGNGLWNDPNTSATNESGFSALPGGSRELNGGFGSLGYNAAFWSLTEYGSDYAWLRYLRFNSSDVYRASSSMIEGLSVRCVRD